MAKRMDVAGSATSASTAFSRATAMTAMIASANDGGLDLAGRAGPGQEERGANDGDAADDG